MSFSMLALLPDVLAANPVIEINKLQLTTPAGDVSGSLQLQFPGLTQQDMMNLPKLKRHIQADMQLDFPAALVPVQSQPNIQALQQKGWISLKDGILHIKLHMADGVLSINQKTVPLPF